MTPPAVNASLATAIAVAMIAYVVLMYVISYFASRKIHDLEDFVVAGRRLPLYLAIPTLLATWFCGGTLLTISDEVRAEGLKAAALDPLGAGTCLIVAGLLIAGPLWRMKLTTVPDFFRERFGPRSEVLAALLITPGYFGWLAAQFVALAGVLNLFFGLDPFWGMALVALVGMGYTLLGGMWAVTLTDAVQMGLLAVGLVVLLVASLGALGEGSMLAGWQTLLAKTPPEHLVILPRDSMVALSGWLGVFAAGVLGNLAGQDLMQRIFSSRSENVARLACVGSGLLYLSLGTVPLMLALAAGLLLPGDVTEGTLPMLATVFMHPAMAIIFVVTMLSAILSTIDSAMLAPASILAQNLALKVERIRMEPIRLTRMAIVLVTAISLAVAWLGESAYGLLEASYQFGMVSLLTPLLFGLWVKRRSETAALAAMLTGTTLWTGHQIAGEEAFMGLSLLPMPIGCMLAAMAIYTMTLPRPGSDAMESASAPEPTLE